MCIYIYIYNDILYFDMFLYLFNTILCYIILLYPSVPEAVLGVRDRRGGNPGSALQIHAHTRAPIRTRRRMPATRTYTRTYVHVHVHVHTCMHMRTHAQTHTFGFAQVYVQAARLRRLSTRPRRAEKTGTCSWMTLDLQAGRVW